MNTTKILIEIKTNGLKESRFDRTLNIASLRFADCFTSAGANVESCVAKVLSEDITLIGLVVRSEPPVQALEDEE